MSPAEESLKSSLEKLHGLTGAVLYAEVRPRNLYNDLSQLCDLLREILPQAEELMKEIQTSW